MNDDFFQFLIATNSVDEFLGNREKISKNKVKCVYCGDVLESKFPNDTKTCSCGRITISGGHNELKRYGKKTDYIEMSQ